MAKLLHSRSYPPVIKTGTSNVAKIYSTDSSGNPTLVWPASNYYDCGYGCQYYSSPPPCSTCYPQVKNLLTALYITGISGTELNYYSILSNTGSTSIDYKLRFTTINGSATTGTLTVGQYLYTSSPYVDLFFSGTTSSFASPNTVGTSFTVELSDDNGLTWTAIISPTGGILNWDAP